MRPTPVPGSYLRFLHYDHINSPLMITDEDGDVVEQIRYHPYGQIRARLNGADQAIGAPDPEDVRYEFTGYESERNSGLLYANARYYDPVVGSFLTHDPAGQFANPYTYTGWDPVNLTDPSGEWAGLAFLGLLIAASVAQTIVNGGDADDAVGAGFFALGTFLLAAGTIGPISPTAPKTWLAVRSLQLASGGYGLAQAFRNEQYIVGATGAALFALGLVAVGSEAPKVVENLFAAPAGVQGGNGSAQSAGRKQLSWIAGDAPDESHDLLFDGKTLRMYDQEGKTVGEWPAVSGRPNYQGPEYQGVEDTGPIPAGLYSVKQTQFQTRPTGRWEAFKNFLGAGKWPGGARSWGDYRVWLLPTGGTETFGRSGFSIHGGTVPGSAGCIDLCGGMPDFAAAFRATGRDLVLRVQY